MKKIKDTGELNPGHGSLSHFNYSTLWIEEHLLFDSTFIN